MTLQKRIFEQLSKNSKKQLSKQKKVDLKVVDELEKALELASDSYSHAFDGFKFMNNIEDRIVEFRAEINREINGFFDSGRVLEIDENVDNLQKLFDELIEKTDELGIDPMVLFPRIESAMTILNQAGTIKTDFKGAYNRVIDESNIGLINYLDR